MSATYITSEEELGQLVSALRAWGISYLTTGEALPAPPLMTPHALLQRLARCEHARVRDASISLFLLHPELAETIRETLATSEPAVAEQLTTLTLAALYLQRLWLTQLALALGHTPQFPEQPFIALWKNRHLPAPALDFGLPGVRALEAQERLRRGLTLNFIGDWQNQIDHLILQEWSQRQRDGVRVRLPERPQFQSPAQELAGADSEQEYAAMSMRPPVDRSKIEQFLQRLGQSLRQPGRIYLVGGSALVHQQVRGPGATTIDIDLWLDVSDEHEVQTAIQRLKNALDVNVELASPGDFIPLPSDWSQRAQYIGRYGSVDVFYFDYYSLALSKIARGNERDLQDIELLAQQGLITRDQLDTAYQEIAPQLGSGRYFNVDAARFAQHYAATVQRVWKS